MLMASSLLPQEWQAARADAERSDGLMGTRGKPAQRQAKMLCSQVCMLGVCMLGVCMLGVCMLGVCLAFACLAFAWRLLDVCMLCSQVTRVHSVVWQRGDAVAGSIASPSLEP